MSTIDLDAIVREELGNIAPDVDLETIDPRADLREALDIDSMDFLNFVTAIHHRIGLDTSRTRLSEARHVRRGARLPQRKACRSTVRATPPG